MRILLDENMPIDFGDELPGFEVRHIEAIGHKGTQNGELIALAREEFNVLVTLDRGILHQHRHFGPLIIVVIRVPNSQGDTIRSRAEDLRSLLTKAKPGDLVELPIFNS